MSGDDYNYATFDINREGKALGFAHDTPKATGRAPDLPLEDLETGATVQMRELWSKGPVVIEFGSFT